MFKIWVAIFLYCITLVSFGAPLPAKEAFQFSTKRIDPNTLTLNWQIHPNYFLYQKRIKLTQASNAHFSLGHIYFPKPLSKTGSQGKTYPIYRNQISIPVAILGKASGEAYADVRFQGCSDAGFCYPPEKHKIKLTLGNDLALVAAEVDTHNNRVDVSQGAPHQINQLENILDSHNWWVIGLSFFGFGLLLSFTPCILPMIPILSGMIVGHGNNISTRKAFILSLCYVLSMSVTYSIIGAVIALLGKNLQVILQSAWVIGIFGILFVVLALSMFNFFELKLPLALQNKLASITRRQHGGHYLSAMVMGCMSILVLSPCVTPPMIGILSYVAQNGSLGLGMLALFCVGLGMGLPLILIGTSAGKLLPRAGKWMNAIKTLFGILFLGVAIYLFGRIVPSFIHMTLWATLLIFTGIYLGAMRKGLTNRERLGQGLGIIFLVYGLLILIGASQGNSNPLQPLAQTPTKKQEERWVVKTLSEAKTMLNHFQGSPVVLDFYADWCASCKVMEATTLQEPGVQQAFKEIKLIKVDLTANTEASQSLLKYFNVIAPPTFIFFDKEGMEQPALRTVGEISSAAFINKLNQLKKHTY